MAKIDPWPSHSCSVGVLGDSITTTFVSFRQAYIAWMKVNWLARNIIFVGGSETDAAEVFARKLEKYGTVGRAVGRSCSAHKFKPLTTYMFSPFGEENNSLVKVFEAEIKAEYDAQHPTLIWKEAANMFKNVYEEIFPSA